jgi:hypothetical protein
MANNNKTKKYHFIYKTINLLNEEYYVGMHSTSNLKDGYLGSGTRLRRSIRKYGESNFKLEILEFLSTREELVKREKELVNEELIKDSNCLNLKPGGNGGFCNDQHRKRFLQGGMWGRALGGKKTQRLLKQQTSEVKRKRNKKIGEALLEFYKYNSGTFSGKEHSIETIEYMKQSRKGTGKGNLNSQYGTCWITNGVENKKVSPYIELDEGWFRGRTLK